MKKLLFLLLTFAGFSQISFGQTGFSFDSIANPQYICQAHNFNVEVFGMRASGSTQNGSQNYFISNDTIYAQFHFVGGIGPAVPSPIYRSITIPAPFNFGRYKIAAQGIGNGQVIQTLYSAISICSSAPLNTPEELKNKPELRIYPNPAQDFVKIMLPTQNKPVTLKLTNIIGKTLRTLQVPAGLTETQLNLKDLPSGVYLVQVKGTDQILSKKLIKH